MRDVTWLGCFMIFGALSASLPALASTPSTSSPPKDQNLVVNPSFEEVEDKKLKGWTPQFRATTKEDKGLYTKDATFTISRQSATGTRSAGISIKDLSGGKGYAVWFQLVPVMPNTTYRVSVKARKEGSGWACIVVAMMTRDSRPSTHKGTVVTVPAAPEGKWVNNEAEVTTGPDVYYADIELRGQNGTVTAWFDDVSLVKVDTAQ